MCTILNVFSWTCYNIASVLCFGFSITRHVGVLASQPRTKPSSPSTGRQNMDHQGSPKPTSFWTRTWDGSGQRQLPGGWRRAHKAGVWLLVAVARLRLTRLLPCTHPLVPKDEQQEAKMNSRKHTACCFKIRNTGQPPASPAGFFKRLHFPKKHNS